MLFLLFLIFLIVTQVLFFCSIHLFLLTAVKYLAKWFWRKAYFAPCSMDILICKYVFKRFSHRVSFLGLLSDIDPWSGPVPWGRFSFLFARQPHLGHLGRLWHCSQCICLLFYHFYLYLGPTDNRKHCNLRRDISGVFDIAVNVFFIDMLALIWEASRKTSNPAPTFMSYWSSTTTYQLFESD